MRRALAALAVIAVIAAALYAGGRYQLARWYAAEDPVIWLPEIWAFEAADRSEGFPRDAVVFAGSSSIRFWDTLAQDMAPIPIIRRGFGGSRLGDAIHYVDRIVTKYDPAAVVIFSGTNDITPRRHKSAEAVLNLYVELVDAIHARLPGAPIYYIAITPSPSRWSVWPIAEQANRLIAAFAANHPSLQVIDTSPALLGPDGEPRPEMYQPDGLHLSEAGYREWTAIIKPYLLRFAASKQQDDKEAQR